MSKAGLADALALLEPHASRLTFAAPAKKATLAALEKAVGKLPDDVRAWFSWHDGQREPKGFHADDVFTALDAATALAQWQFLRGEDQPWSDDWLPLFGNGGGDYTVYVLRGKLAGQLLAYSHEDDGRPRVAKSLAEHIEKTAKRVDKDAKAMAKRKKFGVGEPGKWTKISYAAAKQHLATQPAAVGTIFRWRIKTFASWRGFALKVKDGAGWVTVAEDECRVFEGLRTALAKGSSKYFHEDGQLFEDPADFYPGLEHSRVEITPL